MGLIAMGCVSAAVWCSKTASTIVGAIGARGPPSKAIVGWIGAEVTSVGISIAPVPSLSVALGSRRFAIPSPGWLTRTITTVTSVSYTHLRAHETDSYLVCRLLL